MKIPILILSIALGAQLAVLCTYPADYVEPYSPPAHRVRVPSPVSVPEKKEKSLEVGIASWYDYELRGVEWSKNHATCASRTLRRYSYAKVTNLSTGASVVCYVNDYIVHPGRIIDLSSYAFRQLAPLSRGLVRVSVEQQ